MRLNLFVRARSEALDEAERDPPLVASADTLLDLLKRSGAHLYGGEAVSQLTHALQAAELAQRDRADDDLVVACLLHDIGHMLRPADVGAEGELREQDHEGLGARLLAGAVSTRAQWLVAHHVAAKRYLCGVSSAYHAELSPASRQSLVLQGGPMGAAERQAFIRHPWSGDALRLRRWDDHAKDPSWMPSPVPGFEALLRRCVRG